MKNKILTLTPLIIFLFMSMTPLAAQKKAKAQAEEDTKEWRYEVQCMGVGVAGTKLIKIWSYSKNPMVAIEQAKKNAIHALVFKGFAGNSIAGCPVQKPLVDNPELEKSKATFFNSFFADGGKYMQFVTVTNNGSIAAEDRMKIGKEYKIGMVVSVLYSELRKELETAGVVKSLSAGF